MPSKNYYHLASIYSHLMHSINYKEWSDYLIDISREISKEKISVLEIASGTGTIASILYDNFDFFVGSDLSLNMMKQIRAKDINKICCNFLQLPFKYKFDFIFSTFDSINYLTKKSMITNLLQEIDQVLVDNGIFTFDVSLENNSLRYYKYLNRKGRIDGIKFRQISKYDKLERMHYNYFDITLADGRKVEEIHKQKIYCFEEYFDIIEKSNFYVYNCYDAFTFNNANPESERAQFILKKKG